MSARQSYSATDDSQASEEEESELEDDKKIADEEEVVVDEAKMNEKMMENEEVDCELPKPGPWRAPGAGRWGVTWLLPMRASGSW